MIDYIFISSNCGKAKNCENLKEETLLINQGTKGKIQNVAFEIALKPKYSEDPAMKDVGHGQREVKERSLGKL